MKKFNYKLEIEIFRNSTQKIGCPERFFLMVWVSKKAKTMVVTNLSVSNVFTWKYLDPYIITSFRIMDFLTSTILYHSLSMYSLYMFLLAWIGT